MPEQKPLSQAARIRAALLQQIEGGLLRPGGRLPSERALAELFATTRITLKEALGVLEAEGRVYREERRGWFVAFPRLEYAPLYGNHFQQMADTQQRAAETRLLSVETVLASPELCRALEVPPLSSLWKICRQRSLDGRVALYVEHFLRPERFPDIQGQDLSQSLTGLYRHRYGIEYAAAAFDILPAAAQGRVAQALMLAEGSPVLLIRRINRDAAGAALDCDYEYWRHDAVRLRVDSPAAEAAN